MAKRFGFEAANADDEAADKMLEEVAKGLEGGPPAPPAPAPAPGPAPEPVVPPAPPAVAAPVVDADDRDLVIEALKASLAESKQKESITSGRLKVAADENKLLKTNAHALEARVAELEKAKPAVPAPAPETVNPARVKTLQDDFGLDEASAQRFDTTIQDAISAGVAAQLTAMGIKPGTTPPAAPVAEPAAPPIAAPPVEDESTLMSDADMNLLKRLVPNLDAILNYDAKGNVQGSPELTAFFAQVDPKAKMSIGAMAQQAVNDKDPVRLAAIYNEFKAVMATQGKPIRPIAPRTGPGGPGALDNGKPQYSLKEAEAFMKHYQKNVGNYTPDELKEAQAKLDEYEQAGLEGRLI